jgi:hypothetical protein
MEQGHQAQLHVIQHHQKPGHPQASQTQAMVNHHSINMSRIALSVWSRQSSKHHYSMLQMRRKEAAVMEQPCADCKPQDRLMSASTLKQNKGAVTPVDC